MYYKSIVYGLVNIGYYEQAILFNPYINCYELVDYLDKESKDLTPIYQLINDKRENWILYEKTFLLKLKKYLKENSYNGDINLFQGYREVFDDFDFMLRILNKKKVPISETKIEIQTNEDENEWNYIRTQEDADKFMKLFVGFHDSTMDKIVYEEDYGKKQLNVIFDNSGWYGVVELCFEGLIRMNLQSYSENYTREIYDATLLVQDECVYWADSALKEENLNYNGNWIKALNLKWRKLS